MHVMGINENEKYEILRLLAGILYLGNITFVKGSKDDSHIGDEQGYYFLFLNILFLIVVAMFAHLIQSDVQSCSKALCFRTISTGTQGRSARVSTYACPQNVEGVIKKKLKYIFNNYILG